MFNRVLLVLTLAFVYVGVGSVHSQEKFVADRVVAVVGGSAILYSEIDELGKQLVQQRREQGYTSDRDPINEALEQMLMQKLLYTQAQIDSLEVGVDEISRMVEERIDQMIRSNGSATAVEAFFHKPMFDIREDMRIRIEEMRLAQRMQQEVRSKVKITPGEVDRFVRKTDKDSLPTIPEQYVYAQITKFPSSTDEAKMRVRERLLEMRERIMKGTRFDILARMYSVDGSAVRGGEMDPTPKEGFVAPFADALSKLKVGQVSEVVETEYGFHLIELISKDGNMYRCRHILLRPIFTDSELHATDKLLDSIVNVVRAGDLTFEDAALKYSDDKYSKLNGGLVSNHDMLEMYNAYDAKLTTTQFLKEELAKDDYLAINKMKVGEISDSFQTQDMRGNVLSKSIKLLEIIPSHPAGLKQDYLRLEELALQDKQDREFDAWLKKKIDGMYIRIDEDFRDGEFENKAWLK